MICAVEGWLIYTTPLSVLGVNPITKKSFTYFLTIQAILLAVLYKRRDVKPFLMFIGVASLILVSIYDMKNYTQLHNIFAAIFFLCQPLIFFLEYKKKKDPYELTKGAVFIFLMILLLAGILPIPLFEFLAYSLLILFI